MVRYLFYTIGDLTYQSPLICNEQKGMETLLTALFQYTQWEEHPCRFEGEISADIMQKLRQFGNL